MTNFTHSPNKYIEKNSTSTTQTQDWLECDEYCTVVYSSVGIGVAIALVIIMFCKCLLCKIQEENEDLENQENQSSIVESSPIEFLRTSSLPTYEKAVVLHLHDKQETPPPTYYKLFFIEKSTSPMSSIA